MTTQEQASRTLWFHARRAIHGPGWLAGPPPGGRTSGHPFSYAVLCH